MKITLGGDYIPEFDETPASIHYWYDRHERSYRVWIENKDGFQIGEATWMADKTAKDHEVEYLKKLYNLK